MKCKDDSIAKLNHLNYRTLLYLIAEGYIVDCENGSLRIVAGGNELWIPINELFGGEQDAVAATKALELGWNYKQGFWEKNDLKFKHVHVSLLEVFEYNFYAILDVRGRTVVDVGAHIGDSSIYFAKKGASRVYAIEPHPRAFTELMLNVDLNGLRDKIIGLNMAISTRESYVYIPDDVTVIDTQGKYFRGKEERRGMMVKATSLQNLIKDYSIPTDVLKMDCEGCEFDVIINEYETVAKFNELFFEYHAYAVGRPLSDLLRLLNKDFTCENVNREYYRDVLYKDNSYNEEVLGSLYCVKRR